MAEAMEEREASAVALSDSGEEEGEWDNNGQAMPAIQPEEEEAQDKVQEHENEREDGQGGDVDGGVEESREAEEEENVDIAYDDIDHYEESDDQDQNQEQEFEDDFEDDFEEEESEAEVLHQEQQQEEVGENVAEGSPEQEQQQQEEVEPAAQSFETQTEGNAPEPESEVLQTAGDEEGKKVVAEDSIGTSPMEFPAEPERLKGDLPEEETLSEETKTLTEMTFKPPTFEIEQAEVAEKPIKAPSPEPSVEAEEEEDLSKAEPVAAHVAPPPPPHREEVVAITSNPITSLLEREHEKEGREDPAIQNAAAAEQYKQYEQYQAGLELERQLEKLDMQRKTSMEHISRDLFNATTKQNQSQSQSQPPHPPAAASYQDNGGGDLAANVDTSYVSVPTVERVKPHRSEWMMPEVKENVKQQQPQQRQENRAARDALETDLDKDLRNRLNMTDLEREHYTKENQVPLQHGTTKLGKIASTRTYLESTVVPVLREAMKDLARKRPENPFDFLIEYLQRNRPSH